MSNEAPVSVGMEEVKIRSALLFCTIGVFAAIIFGLLYLFVLAPTAPGSSAGWFLFAFATGITMIVMPCTLPLAFVIVPLSMGKGIAKGLGIALAFGIGIAVTQSFYGVIAALIGSFALGALGAPLESVKNWVYLVAGIFALLFALGEIGLIKVRMPTYSGAAPAFIQRRQDVVKAFLLGLFLGNIGIGCPHPATPLLLIEAASSGNVAYGWVLFMTHAIGRILPLLLLSFLGILGVNGLSWLMSRKEAVERATGWAMVFVAGFILTLGLFTHVWWVNSGIHSALESVTNEQYFNQWFNNALNTEVAHLHGLGEGPGMFGLPLWLGNWFLVLVWLTPMWWWWTKKRKALLQSPVFRLREIESRIDRLEKSRRDIEGVIKLDDTETDFDLGAHRASQDALEKARREAEAKVQFGETGVLKEPLAQIYELKALASQRNYLLLLSLFLPLVFIYFLPQNFYLRSTSGANDHHGTGTITSPTHNDGRAHGVTDAVGGVSAVMKKDVVGLPEARPTEIVRLRDGDIYEVTASYVKKNVGNRVLRMMAYNGSVPGPFIYAPQGSTVQIAFTNNTDIDQTIHSHGVRVSNEHDGVPGITQEVVKPGQRYTYTLTFKDAGVAWYHPHTRDDIGQEMGLYGNYIIDPTDTATWSRVNRVIPLVVDDALIENNAFADFYSDTVTNALLGRFGNTFLVNGEEGYTLPLRKGEVVRFLVTNVSNARTYNLMIPGAELKIVGGDLGRFEKEYTAQSFMISPAERVVVEAYFKEPGTYRLTNATPKGSTSLANFAVADDESEVSYVDLFRTLRQSNDDREIFARIREKMYAAPDKRLKLTIDLKNAAAVDHGVHAHGASGGGMDGHMMSDGTMMQGGMGMMGGVNAIQWDDIGNTDKANTTKNVTWKVVDMATGLANEKIDLSSWTFKKGSLVKISITNEMMAAHTMQHPIHIHGQRFVELAKNGVQNINMVWKDTLLVLPGETVDIVVDMSNTGNWMLHCHIVEHLFAGMMLNFRVEEADGSAAGDAFRNTRGSVKSTPDTSSLSYNTPVIQTTYTVASDKTTFRMGSIEYAGLSFKRSDGTDVILKNSEKPLTVTFIKNDDKERVVTYLGKNDFVVPSNAAPIDPESVPHSHEPGMGHSFNFIQTVYAHNGVNDGHKDARTYSVPVLFTSPGSYRAFVEYMPEGETAVYRSRFDVQVAYPPTGVDAFGWSPRAKWWILLLTSLALMAPLVWYVRRYINKPLHV
jgi:suppressor of ftsI